MKMKQTTAYLELMEAATRYQTAEKPKMQSPEDIAFFVRPLLQGLDQEAFFVLHLSARNHLIGFKQTTVGLVDRAQIHAREVFRDAILANCCRIVLVHNHPSGDPTPSPQDVECTRSMSAAGKIIGIEVIDHLVIGHKTPLREKDFMSFREAGLL